MKKTKLKVVTGGLPSLKKAVEQGVDGVYTSLSLPISIYHFSGSKLSLGDLKAGIDYAHSKKVEICLILDLFPQFLQIDECFKAIETAYHLKMDGIILADLALLKYTSENFPSLPIWLSARAGASNLESIKLFERKFKIKGVILPQVLTLDEIKEIRDFSNLELEVFVFGPICINYEGRCLLSSYFTNISDNSLSLCSPTELVELGNEDGILKMRLNGYLLNELSPEELCYYPTPCRGKYFNLFTGEKGYSFQSPLLLNALSIFPQLIKTGIDTVIIEGRQGSKRFIKESTFIFQQALKVYFDNPATYKVEEVWQKRLDALFAREKFTLGCFLTK